MICEKCGQQIADNSTTCPYCQAAVTPIETVSGEVVSAKKKLSTLGILSIVCGGCSIVIGGLFMLLLGIFGIIVPVVFTAGAIVLAILEKKKNPDCGKLWLIGLIVGIVGSGLALAYGVLQLLIIIIAVIASM